MCDFPVTLANPNRGKRDEPWHIQVPCNKCAMCYKRRANHWFLRLMYESKEQYHADFITLTFETPPRTINGYFTAPKKVLQDYFKRLRKKSNKNKISYYACSEYGHKGQRPHYHAIVFGVENKKHYLQAWNQPGQGIIDIDTLHPGQVRYVTGYIEKRIGIPLTDDDDRDKEFSLMSKNMGLSFLKTSYLWNVNNLECTTTYGGVTYSIPRYYKDRIWPNVIKKWKEPSNDPKKVYKRGKNKGKPLLITKQKTLSTHPTKKIINAKLQAKHFENECREIANFPTLEHWHKNREAVKYRDNFYKSSIIKNPHV